MMTIFSIHLQSHYLPNQYTFHRVLPTLIYTSQLLIPYIIPKIFLHLTVRISKAYPTPLLSGRFLLTSDFADAGVSGEAELKLSRIVTNLKENPHIDILWNDTIDAYTRKIERIQSLLRIKDVGIDSTELNEKINHFLNLCRKPDFEIAFVGAVKAGKSTLINALLGRNYAPTDPNPETAVLTKFRSSEQDYVKVKFYSAKEWDKLWKSVQSDAEKFLEL